MLISYIETAESTESTEGSQRAVPNHKRNVLTVLKWYLLYLIWDTYKLVLQGQNDDILGKVRERRICIIACPLEVRIAAAGKVTKFCRILNPDLSVQHILPCV